VAAEPDRALLRAGAISPPYPVGLSVVFDSAKCGHAKRR